MARTAIHLLRAMRAFSDRPVPDEVIRQSVDGGRCAPYAGSLSQRSVHVRRTTQGAGAGSAVVVRPRSGTAVSPAEGMGTKVRLVIRHDGAARRRHRVDPRAVLAYRAKSPSALRGAPIIVVQHACAGYQLYPGL